jgi:hypothetical protein
MNYSHKGDRLNKPDPHRNKYNSIGPFYSMDHCIVCGSPGAIAPGHVKFTDELGLTNENDDYSCVVYKQPDSIEELKKMILAMDSSCVECIRYCGTDRIAIDLITLAGYAHLIDENNSTM